MRNDFLNVLKPFTFENLKLLTFRSSSFAAIKWVSIASRSITGNAVSMLYTSNNATIKSTNKTKINFPDIWSNYVQ